MTICEIVSPSIRDEQTSSGGLCPWLVKPYGLVNWWEMKSFPVLKFLTYVRGFERMANSPASGGDSPLSERDQAESIDALRQMAEEASEYSLFSTADQFVRMRRACEEGATPNQINVMGSELLNRLEDECGRHLMVMIDPAHIEYVGNPQFFDSPDPTASKVSAQFPSLSEDVAEAGKCFALGRSTACVMHLSRVVESGLEALAKALNVPKQNDWGRYLRKIDEELQNRFKSSGARSHDEQFYSEVHITFDAVRRAWRNPTMHVDKTYTMERAEEILISVRSFMRHLATKLHD